MGSENNYFENLSLRVEDIGVKVKIIDNKDLKAIVTLDFGDFKVKGFRVKRSKYENKDGDKLWVTPPSYKDRNGEYHPIFYAESKLLWEKIKARILSEYHQAYEKHYRKRFDMEDSNSQSNSAD